MRNSRLILYVINKTQYIKEGYNFTKNFPLNFCYCFFLTQKDESFSWFIYFPDVDRYNDIISGSRKG